MEIVPSQPQSSFHSSRNTNHSLPDGGVFSFIVPAPRYISFVQPVVLFGPLSDSVRSSDYKAVPSINTIQRRPVPLSIPKLYKPQPQMAPCQASVWERYIRVYTDGGKFEVSPAKISCSSSPQDLATSSCLEHPSLSRLCHYELRKQWPVMN
ncbi:hypothetical protein E2C01_000630 [Portunus trituberculatus]|uniref:Uncharacterized protein n=1 Tax=Portunus trituberculatus TaxID=210409 RepID=A0A5B7CEV6_PORTR|nr:hypothetical protein [Portunus trituberculatus]